MVQFFEKHDWIARCKVGSFVGLGSRNPDFAAIESQKLIKDGQKGAFQELAGWLDCVSRVRRTLDALLFSTK